MTETPDQLADQGDRLLRLVVVARVGREALLDRRTDDLGFPTSEGALMPNPVLGSGLYRFMEKKIM